MYDLGSSPLPTSFDPATDSDQHSLREFIDLVADAGYVVDSDALDEAAGRGTPVSSGGGVVAHPLAIIP